MQVLLSGNSLALPFVDPLALRREYRSLQSSLWPLPSPAVLGAAQPLVTTKSRNYSAGDMAGFLGDIGLGEAVGPYESRVLPLFGELPAPLDANLIFGPSGRSKRLVLAWNWRTRLSY
jgi:lysophospholipase-3